MNEENPQPKLHIAQSKRRGLNPGAGEQVIVPKAFWEARTGEFEERLFNERGLSKRERLIILISEKKKFQQEKLLVSIELRSLERQKFKMNVGGVPVPPNIAREFDLQISEKRNQLNSLDTYEQVIVEMMEEVEADQAQATQDELKDVPQGGETGVVSDDPTVENQKEC